MQDTLGGDSFGIYRIDNGGRFARLMAASPQTESLFSKSALLENYANIVMALDHGGLWVNRNLEQNLPMYAAGVHEMCIRDSSYYGHVAIVEEVNADGSIKISESNVKGLGVISDRTFTAQEASQLTYIHY